MRKTKTYGPEFLDALQRESVWGRSDLMATAAVRYCLGRQSYIVGDCVDWLIEMRDAIRPTALRIIERDIREAMVKDDEARERGSEHLPLGADIDRREWERALAALATQGAAQEGRTT